MAQQLRIEPMRPRDLARAADWAAAEGWNPGLEDAEAFHAVDPAGFLMGWLGDVPVCAISVVRHSDQFGFLGFYLCHPDHRGQGHGWAIWQAGLAHLGARVVGLDGVPAQEENYRRSGFELAFRSHRCQGRVAGRNPGQYPTRANPGFEPATLADADEIAALDRAVHGADRRAYVTAWVRQTDTRRTLIRRAGGRLVGMGTIRQCREGHKIGPLIAPDAGMGRAMVDSLVAVVGADLVAIDIPETSAAGLALADHYGLDRVFACARMYKGRAPDMDAGRLIGLTSFELG